MQLLYAHMKGSNKRRDMIDEINKIANAMQRQVIKRGNYYYVCNESGQIRLSEHRNIKGVLSSLGGTLECCDVTYAINEENDWRDDDNPCCPECGSDWGGTL